MRKIIVVTPIKNEEWILERFLAVCSSFADHIIIADQHSTDRSREICGRFPKVRLVTNESAQYDEAHRQRLLLREARALVLGEKFILALDADEILTADSLTAASWQQTQTAPPGTAFLYEKPDIMAPIDRCRRYDSYFPLGYVDDGAVHSGEMIHSTRLPLRATTPRLEIHDVKFAHLAHVRPEEFWARQRLYCLIEKIQKSKTLWQRLNYYSPCALRDVHQHGLAATPEKWLQPWSEKGIDLCSFGTSHLNHYNYEVLRLMAEHGAQMFWLDDVWDANWPKLESEFIAVGYRATGFTGKKTPPWYCRIITSVLVGIIKLRLRLRSLRGAPDDN